MLAQEIWLDCDPGHDDALAIMYCFLHERLRLVGVSTVHGNQTVEKTTLNAMRVLTWLKAQDVPVYQVCVFLLLLERRRCLVPKSMVPPGLIS